MKIWFCRIFLLLFIVFNLPFNPAHASILDKKEIVKTAYLTFDDGPSVLTEDVLDILKEKEVPGTFFICGKNAKDADTLLKRMVDEGHAIGNHTYSHNYQYIYKNAENFFQDFYKCEELIFKATGFRTKILRLPGGSNNKSSRLYGEKYLMNAICEELELKGYTYFDWNVSSRDANGQDYSVDELVSMTLSQARQKNDSIILFHDTASKIKTVKALPHIIDGLIEQGFQFKVLSENSFKVTFPLPKVKVAVEKKRPKISKYQLWKLIKIEEMT